MSGDGGRISRWQWDVGHVADRLVFHDRADMALIRNNVKVGGEVALAYAKLLQEKV